MLASVLHSEDSGSDADEPEPAAGSKSAAIAGKWKAAAKNVMPVCDVLLCCAVLSIHPSIHPFIHS